MKVRTMVVTVLTALGSLALVAAPAQAAGEVCYDVNVNVQGSELVNESGCQTLPI
jgi:hypothetical protein